MPLHSIAFCGIVGALFRKSYRKYAWILIGIALLFLLVSIVLAALLAVNLKRLVRQEAVINYFLTA